MLRIGEKAPDFSLPDQNGKIHHLSEYLGKWVLLYFYPKDDTSGCTTEACTLRDNFPQIQATNLVILGVSIDSIASHKKFEEKYHLPFTLLADEEKKVVNEYDVWGEKSFMGKKYEGTNRTSFLINPEGVIKKVYEKVIPANHTKEVLEDLKSLQI